MEADFSGYATVHDVVCSDGRTIKPEAFKHMDGMKVPLVWSHQHNNPENILGHALLEYRPNGVYAYGYFNETTRGVDMKRAVEHKDIEALSIFANKLLESGKNVKHGNIKEVSLVIAGANPGATIDNVYIKHSDGDEYEVVQDEAIIFSGQPLEHEEPKDKAVVTHEDGEEPAADPTVADIVNTMNDEQKGVMYYMMEQAAEKGLEVTQEEQEATAEHGEGDNEQDPTNVQHSQEGTDMTRHLFENNGNKVVTKDGEKTLSHSDLQEILKAGVKGGSLKGAMEDYAVQHGIENIEVLFPDAKAISDRPEFLSRRMEWVSKVLGGTKHSPFSRIKTLYADITEDEARAKGYIKGNFKKEEFFSVAKRVTTPTTIYKKQKLDRDDIVDIVDFDVVAWVKAEMRIMLDEEIARAILIGDGREVGDDDKIKDPTGTVTEGAGVRSILNDHELYVTTVNVNIDDANPGGQNATNLEVADGIVSGMQYYKGSGSPTLFTTLPFLTQLLLTRDSDGRRMWRSAGELATELQVKEIVTVEVMETITDLLGVIVNLTDYTIGADRGGEINFFDDFDIDYNQFKYLYETRISGALTKLKSAIVVRKTAAANVLVKPTNVTWVESTGVVTIPTKAGVVYKNKDTNATLTAGAQAALAPGATLNVLAVPAAGYYFSDNANDEWDFTRPSA